MLDNDTKPFLIFFSITPLHVPCTTAKLNLPKLTWHNRTEKKTTMKMQLNAFLFHFYPQIVLNY